MSTSYSLPASKARTARVMGCAFLLTALLWNIAMAMQVAVPGWELACEVGRACAQRPSPLGLLPEDAQVVLRSDPAGIAEFAAFIERPLIRIGLGCIVLVREGLMVFLLLAIGTTLHRLGRSGDHILKQALPWFKRGAVAALLWSIVQPLAGAVQALLLLPALPEEAWSVPVNLTVAGPALLLAIAAYAIAWALEAGVRAERDLAGFV